MSATRRTIASAGSIVVKIGSSALTSLVGGLDVRRLDELADAIEARMRAGSDVVVVSSGAVGAGLAPLGLTKRPRDLATKQAAASVGQLALAHAWGTSFARYGRTVGQVLLTADDIARRAQHRNAQRTLDRLRALHAVAIVNENDTVATAELRFGDNDRLAALVAHLVGADALVLLSDVDGLYDGDPRKGNATLIPEVNSPEDLDGVVAGSGGALGAAHQGRQSPGDRPARHVRPGPVPGVRCPDLAGHARRPARACEPRFRRNRRCRTGSGDRTGRRRGDHQHRAFPDGRLRGVWRTSQTRHRVLR
ncbi:Glutamate 5-kinase [Rhodococcus opacus PD630]|nr:Glutamate 5-kinase [Rhodococcus opacus PD630]